MSSSVCIRDSKGHRSRAPRRKSANLQIVFLRALNRRSPSRAIAECVHVEMPVSSSGVRRKTATQPPNCSADVIFTFYSGLQERATVLVPVSDPGPGPGTHARTGTMTRDCSRVNETNLLNAIFDVLKPTAKLAALVKLSIALDVPDARKLPRFIRKNMGKYYFDVERNPDAETVRSCRKKLDAIERRLKRRASP